MLQLVWCNTLVHKVVLEICGRGSIQRYSGWEGGAVSQFTAFGSVIVLVATVDEAAAESEKSKRRENERRKEKKNQKRRKMTVLRVWLESLIDLSGMLLTLPTPNEVKDGLTHPNRLWASWGVGFLHICNFTLNQVLSTTCSWHKISLKAHSQH